MTETVMDEGQPKISYTSDVVMGEKYRDTITGFDGVATSVTFFLNACERVGLEGYDAARKKVVVEIFDAPRLVHVETEQVVESPRPGGPGDVNLRPGPNSR